MNNYEIKLINKKHTIIERNTGYIVYASTNKRTAYKKLAHFNMGGCFDGWTPSFFLVDMPENYDEYGKEYYK